MPDRTFQTGTNSEAMVLHPWFPANFGGTVFGHGAEWNTADALGAAPQTVDPGEIVYLQMEVFSDMAGGGQYWKLGSAVGFKGNATDPSVNRGFNDEATLGDNGKNLLTNVEADWTFDTTLDFNGAIRGSDLAQKQDQTRYLNPPTTEELDKTYISTAIFRQGVDAASPFTGTETEVSEVLDSRNGGESMAPPALLSALRTVGRQLECHHRDDHRSCPSQRPPRQQQRGGRIHHQSQYGFQFYRPF